jgi:hypothetical protein
MKSLVRNLDRKKVLLILEWCKKEFGRSRYHRKYPVVRVYRSEGKSSFLDRDGGLYGTYIDGTISIYLGSHSGLNELCKTVIHEYSHYLLSIREYRSLSRNMQKKGSDLSVISVDHPHEVQCREYEKEWGDKCFSELRKKLYSKS